MTYRIGANVCASSPLLAQNLAATADLAREISADCVPDTTAPELAPWLERVHALAGGLVAIRT